MASTRLLAAEPRPGSGVARPRTRADGWMRPPGGRGACGARSRPGPRRPAERGPRRRGPRGDALALLAGLSLRTAAAGDIFAQAVPPCAGEALLSFEAYRGSPRRERFFHRHQWAIVLLRRLHRKALSQAGATESEAGLFYLPAFFGLLLALNDGASAGCLVEAMGSLTATGAFRRNVGYDHFYLHGLEQPVAADFDYAEARWRPDEAAAGLARAVYATLQNVAVVTTGDLAQGGLGASMGGALYGMRRVVTAPFVFAEDCAEAGGGRSVRLAFVGSVQSYNYERVRFLEARGRQKSTRRSQPRHAALPPAITTSDARHPGTGPSKWTDGTDHRDGLLLSYTQFSQSQPRFFEPLNSSSFLIKLSSWALSCLASLLDPGCHRKQKGWNESACILF